MDSTVTNGWSKRFALDPLGPTDPVQFGRFRVLGLLGSDSLSDSYLAAAGEQLAVVKAVRPNTGNMLELREQMAREVIAITGVESPFVARVLAADVNAERPWFARQYVLGVSLERWVAEHGPVPHTTLLGLAGQLALGLHSLHAVGVVHRDLRPANVLISSQGPCLVDFGLVDMPESGRLTQTRTPLRTRVWMAPEQVIGQSATAATDVHAWALVVVFAATGRPPSEAAKSSAVTRPRMPKGTSRELAALVAAALVKDPRRRPTTAEILAVLDDAAPAYDSAAGLSDVRPARLPAGQVLPLAGHQPARGKAIPPLPSSGSAPSGFPGSAQSRPVDTGRLAPRPMPALRTVRRAVGGALAAWALVAVVMMVALRQEPMPTPSVAGSFRPTATAASEYDAAIRATAGSTDAVPSAARTRSEPASKPVRAIDPTGSWTGSAVRSDGRLTYEMRVTLRGDPDNPSGTVSMRNIASNNEGSWEVTGTWRDGQLRLQPGVWLRQPNSTWVRETLMLVALSDTRLVGTTSDPKEPENPTGNVDLYR